MARVFVPAGKHPVIENGRLVGLTPAPTTTKVTPMTTDTTPAAQTVLGRPLTAKETAENAAYKAAFAAATATLGRPPTPSDDVYFTLPRFTSGATDPELVETYAKEKALAENRDYVAPDADAAEAPSAPAAARPAAVKVVAKPDAFGVIYVPGKVCPGPASAPAACGAGIERKPGAGRPPARCLKCRKVDADAAEAKAARKAAAK